MKIATIEDFAEVKSMAMKFIKASGYENYSSEEVIDNLINTMLTGPQHEKIVILGDGGFLAAMVTPFPFGKLLVASEVAWWVNPENRGNHVGLELMEAFEYWAKEKAGASMVSMASLTEDVGDIYEKRGYKLYERAYMKVI